MKIAEFRNKRLVAFGITAVILAVVLVLCIIHFSHTNSEANEDVFYIGISCNNAVLTTEAADVEENEDEPSGSERMGFVEGYEFNSSDAKYISDENLTSEYAVLVDLTDGKVVAQKEAYTKCYPASMTKIMTIIVASKMLEDEAALDDKVTITLADTDYSYVNGLSAVGFSVDEQVTVRDLLYGTILKSGGDAAHALCVYIAGSEEKFVKLMNAELEQMGLSDTSHFANVSGYYDDNNYCTMYDMAMICKRAEENDLCREVMGTRVYTTSKTKEHSDGIVISNWFIRRIEDKETPGKVCGAKTGFVNQSGSCAASYFEADNGRRYACVTGNSFSQWKCIEDHVLIYSTYCK